MATAGVPVVELSVLLRESEIGDNQALKLSFHLREAARVPLLKRLLKFVFLVSLAGLAIATTRCNQQKADESRQQLRKGAAAATEEIKKDAGAIAQGVKEGWNRGNKNLVNINSASKNQMLDLPGITEADAQSIIKTRPYQNKHELVTKGALSENKYRRIADSITTD
jgi:DNA uptake protein ComE-like DNA-binding protein